MWPLTPEEKLHSNHLSALTKGNIDIIGDPGSPEAQLFRDTMARTPPDKNQSSPRRDGTFQTCFAWRNVRICRGSK